MGKSLTYFSMAENDYLFLLDDYKRHRVGNIMCYTAQSICERYLKHLIDVFCSSEDVTRVLKTRSLKVLRKFLRESLKDFECDWSIVLQAEGFYFSARYPGDDSFDVTAEDVEECWQAVEEARNATQKYIALHSSSASDITLDEAVLREIKEFK